MSHANHPPEIPEVTDEAGDTPSWVPLLGAALFVLFVGLIWWSHHAPDTLAEGEAPAAAP